MIVSLEDVIKYFEKELEMAPKDLAMSEEDRMYKLGQLEMLDEIKVLNNEGFPDATK